MKNNRHLIDLIFVIALIGVFAVSSVILVALGINIYQKTYENTADDFETRTSLLYIAEKVRQGDNSGAFSCGDVEGQSALILRNEYNGTSYETWIFYDGEYIREANVTGGTSVTATDGQALIAMGGFDVAYESGILKITLTSADGETMSMVLSPRSLRKAEGGYYE